MPINRAMTHLSVLINTFLYSHSIFDIEAVASDVKASLFSVPPP
jgi:hypothetical protein